MNVILRGSISLVKKCSFSLIVNFPEKKKILTGKLVNEIFLFSY